MSSCLLEYCTCLTYNGQLVNEKLELLVCLTSYIAEVTHFCFTICDSISAMVPDTDVASVSASNTCTTSVSLLYFCLHLV